MENNSQVKLAPSILSADFGCLGGQVAEATKADAGCIRVNIVEIVYHSTITQNVQLGNIRPFSHVPS
ncbi:MAG: hypothetical protein ACE5KP_04815 [Dehalococcoidales bacterium]